MKNLKLIIHFLAIIFLIGCSPESLNEVNPHAEKSLEIKTLDKASEIFKFKAKGIFEFISSRDCNTPYTVMSEGSLITENEMEFITQMRNCSDQISVNELKGEHIDMKGNRMFFYSSDSEISDDGKIRAKLTYYGGTGKYSQLSGEAKILIEKNFSAGKSGDFYHYAEGYIRY